MIELKVSGLAELSKALNTASDRLPKEVTDAVAEVLKSLIQAAPASAMATLPVRGGLARRVAASRFTLTRRGSGVRLTVSNAYDIKGMDRGVVHHPVYGRGSVTQRVPAGWWTKPAKAAEPKVVQKAAAATDKVVKKI